MIKVLAFDVSETLQTGSEHNDNGLGQPMIDFEGEIIDGAYSVLIGGIRTAQLLQEAQKRGIQILLVTNNGDDLDKAVIERTLNFLKKYGINVKPEHYLGPVAGQDGSKVPRLEQILIDFNINQDELMFFDDSRNNVNEAQAAGFQAIRVMSADNLQQGIEAALTSLQVEQTASSVPVTPAHETRGAASSSSSSQPSASPAQQTPSVSSDPLPAKSHKTESAMTIPSAISAMTIPSAIFNFERDLEDFASINNQLRQIFEKGANGDAYKMNQRISSSIDYLKQKYTTGAEPPSVFEQYMFYKSLHLMMKIGSDYLLSRNKPEDTIVVDFAGEPFTLTLGEWRTNYLEDNLRKVDRRIKDLEDNNPVYMAQLNQLREQQSVSSGAASSSSSSSQPSASPAQQTPSVSSGPLPAKSHQTESAMTIPSAIFNFRRDVEDFESINNQLRQILNKGANGSAYKMNQSIGSSIRSFEQRYREGAEPPSVSEQYMFYKSLHVMMKIGSDYLLSRNKPEDTIVVDFAGEPVTLTLGEWRANYLEDNLHKVERRIKDLEDNNPVYMAQLNQVGETQSVSPAATPSRPHGNKVGFWSSSDKPRQKTVEEELDEFMNKQVKQMGFDSVKAVVDALGSDGQDIINDMKTQFHNMRSEQGPRQ